LKFSVWDSISVNCTYKVITSYIFTNAYRTVRQQTSRSNASPWRCWSPKGHSWKMRQIF